MTRTNVFLSGWEYNRLLSMSATAPVQSALPGRVLWTGALHFWLFDKVYCTRESLESEIAAYDKLGWATGLIFAELADLGWLVPVTWSDWANENPGFAKELQGTHAKLVSQYAPMIRPLLGDGRWETLDRIKAELLHPLITHLGCFLDIGPNSLECWFAGGTPLAPSTIDAVASTILQPILSRPNTLSVCRAPLEGLSDYDIQRQRSVELQHEKPMIPAMVAGDLPIPEFHEHLRPHDHAYKPGNEKVLQDWRKNRAALQELRAYAKETIWPKLHSEWLPRAELDASFVPELQRLVRDAVDRAKFPFIDTVTDWGVRSLGIGLGYSMGLAMQSHGIGIPPPLVALAGDAPSELVVSAIKRRRAKSDSLRLFYQRIFKKK